MVRKKAERQEAEHQRHMDGFHIGYTVMVGTYIESNPFSVTFVRKNNISTILTLRLLLRMQLIRVFC